MSALGGRLFSIWDTDGTLTFDSGDAFQQITAAKVPASFYGGNFAVRRDAVKRLFRFGISIEFHGEDTPRAPARSVG